MIDVISSFASWFWTSGAGFWLFVIGITPMIVWEVVKRMPNKKRKRIKRRGR